MKNFAVVIFLAFLSLTGISQPIDLEATYKKVHRTANDTAKVNGLNALAKYHVNKNQDSSRYYIDKALQLATALNYPKGIGAAKLTLGVVESDRGNFPEALELILDAITIAESINDYYMLAGAKLNLGNFYIRTGDVDKALETYKEGQVIARRHGLYYTEASLYTSYGMGLKIKGELDSALYYYEKVLDIHYDKLHDSVVIAAIYNNIAALYATKGDMQTCENYLLKSYEINLSMGNDRYMIMNLANLGEMHGAPGGDFKKSLDYFEQAIVLAKKVRSKGALESIYRSMSEMYYEQKKYKESQDYLKLMLSVSSLFFSSISIFW